MKLGSSTTEKGFTLSEMMVSVGISSLMFAAILTTSVSLQKSLAAADDFFATHMQQIRIIDYLSRDVKRATVVTTSADKQSVTCTLPKYIIAAGDADAGTGNVNAGKRRSPTITPTANGAVIDYGATSATIGYTLNNQTITRTEDGVVTTIAASTDSLVAETTDVELSNTEFATSTVTFLPTFNFNPANNGSPPSQSQRDKRDGTTVFAKAYLRNKRRG